MIGLGKETNLNEIAAAGGTEKALIVDTTDPAQIGPDFEKTLDLIRGQALSCDLSLPAPPAGKVLDIDAVNVILTDAAGGSSAIPYSKDCASGTGWHYDDVTHPAQVQLCTASCDAAKARTSGKVQVVFGCATEGGVVK